MDIAFFEKLVLKMQMCYIRRIILLICAALVSTEN